MRRAGAIAAMLACIVYTMLATWHGVLMQSAKAQASTPEAALELALKTVICHAGQADEAIVPDGTPTPAPSPGQAGDCSVCKGLAACHLVLLVAAELGLLTPPESSVAFDWAHESGAGRTWIMPRNRGPPSIS